MFHSMDLLSATFNAITALVLVENMTCSGNIFISGRPYSNFQCNNITALVSVESMTCSGRPYSNRSLIKA